MCVYDTTFPQTRLILQGEASLKRWTTMTVDSGHHLSSPVSAFKRTNLPKASNSTASCITNSFTPAEEVSTPNRLLFHSVTSNAGQAETERQKHASVRLRWPRRASSQSFSAQNCSPPKSSQTQKASRTSLAVVYGRLVCIVFLLALAIGLGALTHWYLQLSEKWLAQSQYEAIVKAALRDTKGLAQRKLGATKTLASIVAHSLPNASAWPFVTLPGFTEISMNIMSVTSARELALVPFVQKDQIEEFQSFALQYYDSTPGYPADTAQHGYFRGISAEDEHGNRFWDVKHNRAFHNNISLWAPILQHSDTSSKAHLLNLFFEKARAEAITELLQIRANKTRGTTIATGLLDLTSQTVNNTGPSAVVMSPIFPNSNPSITVGFIASPISWREILDNVFPESTQGIVCVLKTQSERFSFQITEGKAELLYVS